MRKLSELEGIAVGIINKRQPCTAYSLRKELKASPSSHWQASAGAIYPLLSRLEDEDLISSASDDTDRRGRRLLSITQQGTKALKAWIKDIAEPGLVSQVHDPLRSRVFFWGALTSAEQKTLADETLSSLKLHLTEAEDHLTKWSVATDPFDFLGSFGAVASAEARIKFLKKVQSKIKQISNN